MASGHRRARFAPRFWVILMLPVIVALTWNYGKRETYIAQQEQELIELNDRYYEACMEGVQIRQQLENVGTEEFIERTARREYGYMMPGEARFVVSNLPREDAPAISGQPEAAADGLNRTSNDPLYVPEA